MAMTSGARASMRCLTRAKAACTRRTRSRSSVGGRIRSWGVCAQAKAPTSISRRTAPSRRSLAAEHGRALLQHGLPALGGIGALVGLTRQLVDVPMVDLVAERDRAEEAGLDPGERQRRVTGDRARER